MPKRLIEDVLPLTDLNQVARKGGGIGSLNAMHPYFARRPLTASRAMTLAALLNAPADDATRRALERLLVDLSSEEWPVAQAVVELLGRDSAERTALMSLLGTRGAPEMRAQRWAERHPRVEAKVEVVYGTLWRE